jgi:predicted patatin/cPLA2 family phospholipase
MLMQTLLEVLREHKENRDDKRVFGLVVQGGGMRAVYSASALAVMVDYELVDAFEHIVGSSAGAINAAYFTALQKEAIDLYSNDLANKKFINLFRKDKKVDIDYLVDNVLKQKRPININMLKSASSKLHIVITNYKNGKKEVISNRKEFLEIYEEFRATSALPVLYDKVVQLANKYYIDGGVADLIPLDVAYKLGCTDIVVIMTQQISSYNFNKHHKRLVKHLIKKFAKRYPNKIKNILPTNEKVLKSNLRHLKKPWRKIKIYLLQPSDEEILISLATIDKEKIRSLAKLGVSDTELFLNSEA